MPDSGDPGLQRPPRWLRRFAEFGARRGWARAQVMLGAMLEREPPINVNLKRANDLYRSAAEQGNAQAMWNLGVNYLGTKGGERNTGQAIHWLQRAAGNGHALATWALARMYLAGTLVEQNREHGLAMLKRSALVGCAPARQALADIYRQGSDGVAPDPEAARQWAGPIPWHRRLRGRLGFL